MCVCVCMYKTIIYIYIYKLKLRLIYFAACHLAMVIRFDEFQLKQIRLENCLSVHLKLPNIMFTISLLTIFMNNLECAA